VIRDHQGSEIRARKSRNDFDQFVLGPAGIGMCIVEAFPLLRCDGVNKISSSRIAFGTHAA